MQDHNSSCRGHCLVFTDLDGTLLDDQYDLVTAAQVLNQFSQAGVYSIPATSKTQAELAELPDLLCYAAPLICENGTHVRWPEDWAQEAPEEGRADPISYTEILATLATLRATHGYEFRGFADMSAAEVAARTGLQTQSASCAKQRQASEPIVWFESTQRLTAFQQDLSLYGLKLVRGGRFWHVMRTGDKGSAAAEVARRFQRRCNVEPMTIACGDSPNDIPLLNMAEHSILFPGRDGTYLTLAKPADFHAAGPGPIHWRAALTETLENAQVDLPVHQVGEPK